MSLLFFTTEAHGGLLAMTSASVRLREPFFASVVKTDRIFRSWGIILCFSIRSLLGFPS
jgi:hypothetical protein